MTHLSTQRVLRFPQPRLVFLCVVSLLTAGCSVQWGAPQPTPTAVAMSAPEPSATPTETASVQQAATIDAATVVAATETAAVEPSHWTVGLTDQPANILPFSPDARVAEPIAEAIFPSPALGLSYSYTTTGILAELPTPDNGGVERRPVAGFLDATGLFTTTATDRPTTTDQLVVTFRWNPDLKWADGTPVTAADSVFSYTEAQRAPTSPAMEALLELVEQYEAVDASTTRATLAPGRVDPGYLLAAWPPLPRHLLENAEPEARERYARAPVGYGPYTFSEWTPEQGITLVRNEFWPRRGLRDQLRFHFFAGPEELRAAVNRGEVDVAVVERLPSDLFGFLDQDATNETARVTFLEGPVYEHLDFNLVEPLLQDVRVRRAIAHAIDRQEMVDTLFGGKTSVLESWIFPEQPEFAGEEQLRRYPHDPSRARALLDQAGIRDTGDDGTREMADGTPITLTLLTTDTPQRAEIGRQIERDLRAVGLRVETRLLPIDELYSPTGPLFRRQFQLAEFGWLGAVEPNGLPLWSCAAIPGPENGFTGNNFGGWCFDPAEAALRAAANTLDERARAAAYLRHQQLWTQESPSIPLLQRPIAVLQRPELHGVAPDPLAPITWNVDDWR